MIKDEKSNSTEEGDEAGSVDSDGFELFKNDGDTLVMVGKIRLKHIGPTFQSISPSCLQRNMWSSHLHKYTYVTKHSLKRKKTTCSCITRERNDTTCFNLLLRCLLLRTRRECQNMRQHQGTPSQELPWSPRCTWSFSVRSSCRVLSLLVLFLSNPAKATHHMTKHQAKTE